METFTASYFGRGSVTIPVFPEMTFADVAVALRLAYPILVDSIIRFVDGPARSYSHQDKIEKHYTNWIYYTIGGGIYAGDQIWAAME